ncbi:MAG TPA: hypothetical protein VN369_01135 [Terriglobales bacterium]|nr:hypothetical protein [Terriglobales bacterium]
MYIHLGRDVVVRDHCIIGIFDLDKTTTGAVSREFLSAAEKAARVTNVSSELPKSFVVTVEDTIQRVYISPISTATLSERLSPGRI